MWRRRQRDGDVIAWCDRATCGDDAHDACLANQLSFRSAPEYCCSKTRLESVQLFARIAQAGEPDHGGLTDVKLGAGRQSQEVDTARRDVLADPAWMNLKPLRAQLFKELLVNEMDLPEIGLCWILCQTRAVLDRHPAMSISLDTQSSKQVDAGRNLL